MLLISTTGYPSSLVVDGKSPLVDLGLASSLLGQSTPKVNSEMSEVVTRSSFVFVVD